MTQPILVQLKILSHPWYKKWECGELPVSSLQHYAGEYYWQVAHFPRYLSRLHSQLEELKQRQVILGNLADEENAQAPHPELWLDFAEAMGRDRQAVRSGKPGPAVQELITEFQEIVASGPAQGLGAILAYESQVPEVAQFKSAALKKHYLKPAEATHGTRFFDVHAQADVWHAVELQELVGALSEPEKRQAQQAADQASRALWRFLDAMPN